MRFFLMLMLVFALSSARAQKDINKDIQLSSLSIQKKQKDYSGRLDSLILYFNMWNYVSKDSLVNPYYITLFSNPTYYYAPIQRNFSIVQVDTNSNGALLSQIRNKSIDEALMNVYAYSPQLVTGIESDFQNDNGIRTDVDKDIKQAIKLAPEKKEIDLGIGDEAVHVIVHRPNFWKFTGNYSLQFLQNYISDNWYKGGESNNSLLASVTVDANYNNKQKLQWDNRLELKLGFQSSRDDKIHEYKTHSDQIRMTNKVGLRATKYWFYTFMLQSWTQFYPGYKANDEKVYSDFMSPFESVFSIGMEFKLDIKNFNISANASPFACDFKYVDRKKLSTSFGVKANKHSNFDFGSNITINYTWKIISPLSWRSRIYYFTDYDKAQLDWENTIDLRINKYLTTTVFLHPRFDDSANKGKDDSYFQFKEYISLGLNMSF